jgi:hypothetical protein
MPVPVSALVDAGLDADLTDRLARAGVVTLDDVRRAGAEALAARADVPLPVAERIVRAAQRAGQADGRPVGVGVASGGRVLALAPDPDADADPAKPEASSSPEGPPAIHGDPPEPPQGRRRGLALARRLQQTAELAQRCRRRVKRADAKGRKKCRRHLARLLDVLTDLEHDAIKTGVSPAFLEDARRILSDVDDALLAVVERGQVRTRHVKRLKKDARHARRRLEALLWAPTDAPPPPAS